MSHRKWLLHKLFNAWVLISCILSLILGVTQTALAAYQPPPDQKPPTGYSDSSGVRGGCQSISGLSLILLAPVTHVGRTTSLRPTFAWFVPDGQPMPIEFSLYEFDIHLQPQKLNIYMQSLQSSPGVMKLSLPQELPGLTVGKRYLWQLQTLCNLNRPSHNPVVRAEIEVVKIPQSLASALSATSDRSLKTKLYATAGMWYDALAQVLSSTSNKQMRRVAASLLTGLAKLEQSQNHRDLINIAIGNW